MKRAFAIPFAAFLLLGAATAVAQKDMGVGWCPLHKGESYRGKDCPKCLRAATGGGSAASGGGNGDAQLVAGLVGSLLGELLRGNPAKTASLEAEARERALAYQRAAAEVARKKNESYARLFGEMKLGPDFDGDGGLKLKGVGGETETAGGPALKLGDGDLKPKGTSASPNDRDTGDPMVVDLRNFQRAFYVASRPDATPDAIVAAAQGDVAVIVPTADAVPLSGAGLKRFQEANNAYRRSHHDGQKEAEYFNQVQNRREIVGRELRDMKADLERQLALEKDTATLARKHERMGQIFAAARAEHEAYLSARMELDARRAREAFDRARLLAVVKAPAAPDGNAEDVKEERRVIAAMNKLVAVLPWPADAKERAKAALENLGAGVRDAKAEEITGVWVSMGVEWGERERAAQAAVREGPVVLAAGQQTDQQDCGVYAVASVAGLPYETVRDRAALLIRQGEWRSAAERADAPATVLTGLNGGEVILLAESFGRAEVVPSTEFAGALRQGHPVLVNIVPPSGNVKAGHEVVLTRTYQREGVTWFEMLDSNRPDRRRHLSLPELDILVKERGVVFRAGEEVTPILLRGPGDK